MSAESPETLKAARQVLSYALIGGLTNLFGYTLYLLLTSLGNTPKLTMSILYAGGVIISFYANRKFTFRHGGNIGAAGARFILAYLLGYLLNLLLLVMLVDWLGFAHQLVQAVAIIVVAMFLFVLSRIFVFVQPTTRDGSVES